MIATTLEDVMIGWVVLGIGGSCWQRQVDGHSAADPYITQGDRFYMQRSDPEKLDQAIQAWQDGLLVVPEDVTLLSRLAQAYTTRALSNPDHSPDGFIVAREHGIRCLKTDTFLAGVAQTYGGRLVPRALRTVDVTLIDCLIWTSISWSRWLQLHGAAGASLDLEIVASLAEKAVELSADHDRGRPLHALGLALSLPPAPLGPDLDAAEAALSAALEASPDRWWIEVDLAEMIYAPTDQTENVHALLSAVTARSPDAYPQEFLENRAAISHAEQLLSTGSSSGWKP